MPDGGGRSERRLLVWRSALPGAARELFVLPADGGWALPRLDGEARRAADVDEVAPGMRDRFGLYASVLRCVRDAPPGPDGVRRQAFELEAHAWGAGPQGGEGRWLGAADLGGARFGDPEDREALAPWLGAVAPRVSARQVGDWEEPGWWTRALGWAQGELSRRGLGDVAEVVQVRVWEFSHVLRLRTGAGEFYLKARPASGVAELRLTARLAAAHPEALPEVITWDPARHWLLMRAAPGPALIDVGDLSAWAAAARALAAIQIDWVGRAGELAALGCPERSLDRLVEEVEPLLADRAALQPDDPEALGATEIESLRRLAPAIRSRCLDLAALGVPPSLEHGDCWAANVIASDRGPVIIDWEDAAIAHPFLSLFLLDISVDFAPALADPGEARGVIEAAYRAAWQERGPLAAWPGERLAHALALSRIVAPLHYAVLFRHGLSQVETSWEVRGYCPYFLRLLLGAITAP